MFTQTKTNNSTKTNRQVTVKMPLPVFPLGPNWDEINRIAFHNQCSMDNNTIPKPHKLLQAKLMTLKVTFQTSSIEGKTTQVMTAMSQHHIDQDLVTESKWKAREWVEHLVSTLTLRDTMVSKRLLGWQGNSAKKIFIWQAINNCQTTNQLWEWREGLAQSMFQEMPQFLQL